MRSAAGHREVADLRELGQARGLGCEFWGLEARVAEVWLWMDGGRALFASCPGAWNRSQI